MLLYAKRYGIRTSSSQFFFYFISLFTGAAILRSIILRKDNDENAALFDNDANDRLVIFYSIQLGLHLLLFVMHCFADSEPTKYDERIKALQNPCPQISASYVSQLAYFWSTPLLWKGFRNPLTPKDLWDVDPVLTSRGVVPDFEKHLNPVMENAKNKSSNRVVPVNSMTEGKRSGTLVLKTVDEVKKAHSFSLFPAMVRTFGPTFFTGGAMKILYGKKSLLYFPKKSSSLHFFLIPSSFDFQYLVVNYFKLL